MMALAVWARRGESNDRDPRSGFHAAPHFFFRCLACYVTTVVPEVHGSAGGCALSVSLGKHKNRLYSYIPQHGAIDALRATCFAKMMALTFQDFFWISRFHSQLRGVFVIFIEEGEEVDSVCWRV